MAEKLSRKNKDLVQENADLSSQIETIQRDLQNNDTEHLKEIENLKLEHSQQIYMMRRMNWINLITWVLTRRPVAT